MPRTPFSKRPKYFSEFAADADGSGRTLLTPEGAILTLRLASRVERVSALLLDVLLIIGANAIIFLVPLLLNPDSETVITLALFSSFIVNNFYFIYFELAWQGATPGKRANRLKVISRKGGALTPYAVVTRNLTRQFEILLPLISLAGPDDIGIKGPFFAALWFFGVTILPCWNRDRLRVGDMLADTIVIVTPSKALSPDLAVSEAAGKPRWVFTKGQLAVYGDYELMVLEAILRKPLRPGREEPLFKTARRIAGKIGVPLPGDMTPAECRDFLTDFYAAERAALEEGRLYGLRKMNQSTPASRNPAIPPPPPAPTTPKDRFRQGRWAD
ncbi:MAG: RDD family protein [Deltaproteobacteria bacterium]|jgi:uncharacterized RDD family membrane protein YckC|nr:RDD family protein [Deltaproteobacteria bacterium]